MFSKVFSKKITVIVFTLLFTVCASGCWDRREPENLAVVTATGFDFEVEKGMYRIIVQIANPLTMGGGGGGAGGGGGGGMEKPPFWTISALGHTPIEAARELAKETTRELEWSHNGVVIFSEKMARKGIASLIDFFERGRELRLIAKPAVVEGDLQKLMETEFPLEETGAQGLERQITTVFLEHPLLPAKDLRELLIIAARPGSEIFLVWMEENIKEDGDKEKKADPAVKNPIKLRGGAAFKGDRMVGWFDEQKTRGWHWLEGKISRAPLVIKCPCGEGKKITVEIYAAETKLEPVKSKDGIKIKASISVEGYLQDQACPEGFDKPSEKLRSLNKQITQVVRNDIEESLAEAQHLNSDIFGFGNLIHRKMPHEWKKIENQWDEIFPRLVIEIEIEAHLRRSGLIFKPAPIR